MARQRNAKATVLIDGESVPLKVNWHARARRFILRLDARSGGARLTLPTHADLDDAISFLRRHEKWLLRERRQLLRSQSESDAGSIPFRGIRHEIVLLESGPRRVWTKSAAEEQAQPELIVSGPLDTATGRLVRWLKTQARSDFETAVARHAARLNVRPARICVRDQRSRWGSCSSTGTLSFSWRLIMAPPQVLDYVAAHEVAHLRELNHSSQFWRLVKSTYGDTGEPRQWLKTHGPGLHRYG